MRFLPHTDSDRAAMLAAIGCPSADALFETVPASARLAAPLDLPDHQSEPAVEAHLSALAARNHPAGAGPFFIGGGAYRHHVPASVDHLIQRSEWLTAYTPYQPEIAQGTLQMLFEFQTQVAELTGLEVANASMYDGATATAEAALMAMRLTRRDRLVVSGNLHPHYRQTLATYVHGRGQVNGPDADPAGTENLVELIDDATAAVLVQTPDVFGHPRALAELAEAAHKKGALLIVVVTEIVALGLLDAPGKLGADIVVGEGQSLGNPLSFGGPFLGLFATREKFVRQMPGRVCGQTVDAEGRRGFVLTLSTREQHIRREKATSNICTNAGLNALAFSIHLALLGGRGLAHLARLNHARANALADALAAVPSVELLNRGFFNEFTLRLPQPAAPLVERLAERGILAGLPATRLWPNRPDLANLLIVAATELTTENDIAALTAALGEAGE